MNGRGVAVSNIGEDTWWHLGHTACDAPPLVACSAQWGGGLAAGIPAAQVQHHPRGCTSDHGSVARSRLVVCSNKF